MKRSKKEITEKIRDVAVFFGRKARDTILLENEGKHLLEIEFILNSLGNFNDSGRILDVGGGMGINLICLSRLVKEEVALSLIDQFDEYNDNNRMGSAWTGKKLMEDSGISIVGQNFWGNSTLPYPSEHFDVVTCFDVIEHLPGHPLKLFKEIKRILKVNGIFIVGVPNAVSLHRRMKLLTGKHPYMSFDEWCQDKYYQHYREYSRDEMRKLLTISEFFIKEIFLSDEPIATMARNRYHNGQYRRLSRTTFLIYLFYLFEKLLPSMRQSIYCVAKKVG